MAPNTCLKHTVREMVLISYDTRGMRKFAGTKYYKQLKCFNVLISYDSKEMREFARTTPSLATEIRLFKKKVTSFFQYNATT